MASSSISIEYETSTAITSSTLTDGTLCLVSANRDFGLGAAMPATSPPTIVPATSTAPTETHQRMAALPSFHEHGDTQNAPRKAETCNCRPRSQQSRRQTFRPGYSLWCRNEVSGCQCSDRQNARPSGETTERWDVHRYGNSAYLLTVAASLSASPPTFPGARKRSSRATDSCYPSPRRRELWSSRSRRHWIPAAGSKRCASCPPGAQSREWRANPEASTRASPSP